MKKKPALQAILDNLDSYTEEQLSNVQGQPLWIREELVRMKQNSGQYCASPEEIANAMTHAVQPVVETSGEVLEWTGVDQYIGTDRYSTEMRTGDLLLRIAPDQFYTGDILVRLTTPSVTQLGQNTSSKGQATRSQYKSMYANSLLNK
jgi:hypothetical protein